MARKILRYIGGSVAFWVFSVVSATLIVAGFLVPPTGEIDGSVLTAVGELFAFAALFEVTKAIDKGIDAKLTHGNTSITIGDLNDEDDSATYSEEG